VFTLRRLVAGQPVQELHECRHPRFALGVTGIGTGHFGVRALRRGFAKAGRVADTIPGRARLWRAEAVGAASRRAIRHASVNMDTICGSAAQFPFAGFDDDVVHGFLSQLFIEMLPSQRARDGNWQTCSDVSTTVLFSAYSTDDDAPR